MNFLKNIKKQTLIIIGGAIIVAITLLSLWIISFLLTDKKEISLKEKQTLEQTQNKTEKNKLDEIENQIRDDSMIFVNGQPIAYTPDESNSTTSNNIDTLAKANNGIFPGWKEVEWNEMLPKFTDGKIVAIMSPEDAEHQEWVAMIEAVEKPNVDKYIIMLQNNGWEIETKTEQGVVGTKGSKGDFLVGVFYNQLEKQCVVNLAEGPMEN